MVGGTTPPQSDSGEISRVLVLNLLWQSKRCSRTAQDISVLTTPSLLSRGTRRGYEDREGPRRESLGTFPKQLHLPRIRWHASAAAPGGSDNREHCQRFQCQPRHKNSLRIRTQVRRVDQKPFADRERKIIGHHAFEHFVVLKFETHP